MLGGALSSGVLLALMMANAGGAWDNAKKYIEEGHFGGKGSDPHKAAVVGDTVGDPFKDTSGPSINILIKLMTIVSAGIRTAVRTDRRTHLLLREDVTSVKIRILKSCIAVLRCRIFSSF